MTIEKKIKSELSKMSGIMLVLLALGIYAYDFVIAGLQAKLVLNCSIFLLAGVAASLAFRHVLSLKNEAVALKALQVDHGNRRRRPVNPYRHPAIIFNEPELLGHGYRMITEELSKQGEAKISNSTVQMLLHDVDARINDRKSTIMYFSGLMVFLGLLGAFMGLMKTVHSVSDLIGAMDLSATAGVDGMAKMIEGMKAPLNGMSVGFSSSLFGLLTSMVLGALERCMTSAMKALRNEYEHWLSNIADLESNGSSRPGDVHVTVDADFAEMRGMLAASSEQLERLCSAAIYSADDGARTRAALGEVAGSVVRLTETVERLHDPKPMLEPIAKLVSDLAGNQAAMLDHFRTLYEQAESDRTQIAAILGGMTAAVERMNTLDGAQMHQQLDMLATLMREEKERDRTSLAQAESAGFWSWLFDGPSRRSRREEPRPQPVGAASATNSADAADLSGSRLALELLRRRLRADIADEPEAPETSPAPVTKQARGGE
ncbi:hypothetical protein [Sphingosinicella sp. BN140058]|uniref:hypothetical protein n=1 Tax=Sphingosinicella sp. BN140058 TaxID=1892855 RepID=UPI001011947B|nr:hypothetical protein [Sphingosinicella sp. BN140058]QAY76353.1 hypothetical protein ETR14_07505 [Sphingosinicella sp. BN140058]